MKMQMKTAMMFNDGNFKLYDVIAHRSFTINRSDVNVSQTKAKGKNWVAPNATLRGLVFVHDRVVDKTPNRGGRFAVSTSTYNKICNSPREEW